MGGKNLRKKPSNLNNFCVQFFFELNLWPSKAQVHEGSRGIKAYTILQKIGKLTIHHIQDGFETGLMILKSQVISRPVVTG